MKKREIAVVESIFDWSEDDYGTIERPTKKGFVEIAKLGNATWNAWREKHPDVTADFSGTDFETEKINFSGFDFRTREILGERDCVDFSSCNFGINSDFSQCTFGDRCNFSNSKFGMFAIFYKAKFGDHANFKNANFDHFAYFRETEFGIFADFSDAKFDQDSYFEGASFDDHAIFRGTTFLGCSDFSAFLDKESTEKMSKFNSVDFSGATFTGDAKFTGRSFLSTTIFGQRTDKINSTRENTNQGKTTKFLAIPNFHGCKFHQDTSFDNAEFLAPPSPEAARAYRTLKLAMEQLKATREEQRFFRLEMKAEHPSLKRWPRLMSAIYATTSDYGFSLRRPVITLLCVTIMIGIIHGGLANAETSKWQAVLPSADFDIDRTLQWLRYVAINTLPVPGFDKTQMELRDALFGKDGAIVSVAMGLEMIHKVISLGCVFLLGLALRNLFKMKS